MATEVPNPKRVLSSDLIFKSEHVYARLRWLREKQGVSQRELASVIGIAQSEIQRIEQAQEGCRLSSFVKICGELGAPPGWVLDVMIHSNGALFSQRVAADPGFAMLLESLQIKDKTGKDLMANRLVSACLLTAILLRVSFPVRRANFHTYPTDDWKDRFLALARRLEIPDARLDRAAMLRALRAHPIATLQRLGVLSRSSLELARDDVKLPKAERRSKSFGGELFSLTYEEAGKLLGFAVADQKTALDECSENRNMSSVMKLTLSALLDKVQKLTSERGMKARLALDLGVPPPRVNEWLSRKYEPSGEVTLRLLHWVEQQERKK